MQPLSEAVEDVPVRANNNDSTWRLMPSPWRTREDDYMRASERVKRGYGGERERRLNRFDGPYVTRYIANERGKQ